MEKEIREKRRGKVRLLENESFAVGKYIRISPTKIRRILRQIQGKSYVDALTILKFLPYKGCNPVIKVLESAASNAAYNNGMEKSRLKIRSAVVDQGPSLKRLRYCSKGKAVRIVKLTSIITIIVTI
jgi:large subunit ribosomal protein L22